MGVSIVPFYHHYHHHHCHNNNNKGCKQPLWSPMRWRCRLLRWTERTQPGAIGPRGSRSDCSPSAGRRTPANIYINISLSIHRSIYNIHTNLYTYITYWFLMLNNLIAIGGGPVWWRWHPSAVACMCRRRESALEQTPTAISTRPDNHKWVIVVVAVVVLAVVTTHAMCDSFGGSGSSSIVVTTHASGGSSGSCSMWW